MTYGTLLVDLERHRPIDVLPDRQAETLAAWLRTHPGIEIISRDRAGAYAEAAAQGAPNALQVADRWHLLKNLGDALSRVLEPHRRALQRLTHPRSAAEPLAMSPELDSASPLSPAAAARARQRRAQRYQRYHQVCTLRQQGWTLAAIAQTIGLCRKTVCRWLRAGHFPELRRRRRPSRLDPYKPYLLQRWNEGCWTATQLEPEIRAQGYGGELTIVRDFVRQLRRAQGLPPGRRTQVLQHLAPGHPSRLSPLRAAYLVLQRPERWRDEERALVERMRQLDPEIGAALELTQAFAGMIRQRQSDALDPWLDRAAQSPSAPLRAFAAGIRRDYAAVKAALKVEWSNERIA
jgi:transposase